MKIFTIRGCAVRVHPLFFIMLVFLCIGGAHTLVLAFFAVLLLHEAAHCLCALYLHIPIAQIELTPFGGSMEIHQVDALPPGKAFLLSCAGPLCNTFFIAVSLLIVWRYALFNDVLIYFIQCNLFMLLLNLLPVLPLDGGRMLLALLTKWFDRTRILRILLTFGRLLSVFLIVAGFVFMHFSLVTLGCYLLYTAAIEERTGASRYLAAFISRRIRFEKQKTLPVQSLCVSSALPVFMLIPHLHPGAYHVIEVLQEDTLMHLGQIRDDVLLSAILDQSHLTLGELLSPPFA